MPKIAIDRAQARDRLWRFYAIQACMGRGLGS